MSACNAFDKHTRQTVLSNNTTSLRTKRFFREYKEITEGDSVRAINYIYAPTGLCAIYEANVDSTNGKNVLWLVNTDYLGSIVYMFNSDDRSDDKSSVTLYGVFPEILTIGHRKQVNRYLQTGDFVIMSI